MDTNIWLWLKRKTIDRALEALLRAGDDEHQKARESRGTEADEHRAEAEEFHAAKRDLWSANHEKGMRNFSDDSITAHARSNVNKTVIEVSDRTMGLIALILACIAAATAAWMARENDHMYRSIQELRIRVEDAENSVEKTNPNFTPHR